VPKAFITCIGKCILNNAVNAVCQDEEEVVVQPATLEECTGKLADLMVETRKQVEKHGDPLIISLFTQTESGFDEFHQVVTSRQFEIRVNM
jgi:hypothetical protein